MCRLCWMAAPQALGGIGHIPPQPSISLSFLWWRYVCDYMHLSEQHDYRRQAQQVLRVQLQRKKRMSVGKRAGNGFAAWHFKRFISVAP